MHFFKDFLDAAASECDSNGKLEEDIDKTHQENEICPSPQVVAQNLTNNHLGLFEKVRTVNPVEDVEFLNAWEAHEEKPLAKTVNSLFSFTSMLFSKFAELSTRKVQKTVRQRKFPGPAGLLPERQGNTSLIATEEFLDELNHENNEPPTFKEKEVLSQSSGRVFESGAWNVMMEDLGTSGRDLISLMNLASLRLKHTRGYKVPFLAVIINSIDCTLPDPTLFVKDITDEIHGMLHREVWEKFNSEMTPGSVLVLKNVGVISAGATSRRHVLNITTNNLTAIYSNRQDEHVQVRKISELPTGDHSKMLFEWEQIIATPPVLNKSSRSRSFPADSRELSSRPTGSSTPVAASTTNKPLHFRRQLLKGQNNIINRTLQNKSQPEHPFKRFKSVPLNNINSAAVGNQTARNQTSLPVQNKNPFQFDTDTSVVDSLLDGIDTNSLFEEF
ncbi:uncharacterized protein isoform X3 [Rhodnius prolixus]|uniref:uncharacterized protein isoform X3 n=1 Tax=Rhodnius prolixus TaxID=13249 RepID=UPI003D18F85D